MSKGNYYNRYVWLMNTLLQAKRITFEEISSRWERDWEYKLPKRTFFEYIHGVNNMFDVKVMCDIHNGYQYYIDDIDKFKKNRSAQWLLNSFCASNLVQAGEKIKERIIYEDIPENAEYLSFLVDAMKRSRKLEITYLPYEVDEPSTYIVSPYCIRLYRQHWYVLGFSDTHLALRHFAVNRMKNLSVTDDPFAYPDDFSPEGFYCYSSGIYTNTDLPVETIRLQVDKHLVNYYRALPIHHSQNEVRATDDYSEFEYTLCVTPDLIQELLSRGSQVKVLAPESLRKRIKEELEKTINYYI